MSITREELAAFADGELPADRRERVSTAIAAEPALAEQVAAHHAIRARLVAHFAPIVDETLPDRLTAPLQPREAQVVDFATARRARQERRRPRWAWIAAPALAALLALALFMPRDGNSKYASGQLASALDSQLVATQPTDARTRILLSFKDKTGAYCRAFSEAERAGIACRDGRGWKFRTLGKGAPREDVQYRQAGSSAATVMEEVQALAMGPALDAAEEDQAIHAGWR